MKECFFQETKSDLFQDEFYPGRPIPLHEELSSVVSTSNLKSITKPLFYLDPTNRSDWITVIYDSVYYAEKAVTDLTRIGLNVYYPKTRITTTNFSTGETKDKLVAAYGRYLFIQLPEDLESGREIKIEESWLMGPFNQNGFSSFIVVDGEYCRTRHSEIVENRKFHDLYNEKSNPKVALRFREGQLVLVTKGNLEGTYVTLLNNIKMSYKLNSKTEISIGNTGARHFIQVGYLQELTPMRRARP